MEKKIPIYEAKVKGTDNTGIFAMSFVELPANESNFVALQRQRPVKLSIDKQKQLLTGVVLIPDQLIYRNDVQLGEYYLKFTAAEIETFIKQYEVKGMPTLRELLAQKS